MFFEENIPDCTEQELLASEGINRRTSRLQSTDMLKVQHCMKQALTADQDSTIEDIAKTLHEKHVGSVVVVDQERKCIGICTERDIIRSVAHGIPASAPMKKIMTRNPVTVSEEDTLAKARSILNRRGIRHLPVVDKNHRLVGMVTTRGLLEDLLGVQS